MQASQGAYGVDYMTQGAQGGFPGNFLNQNSQAGYSRFGSGNDFMSQVFEMAIFYYPLGKRILYNFFLPFSMLYYPLGVPLCFS